MPTPSTRPVDDVSHAQFAEFVALTTTVKERLGAMEEISRERAKGVDRIESQVIQQGKDISQMSLDMATIKAQHQAFWRGVTMLMSFITIVGAALGWIVAQIIPFMHK